ncbi:centromere protein X isoform X1 [Canis lupus baileyi]|uniref:centromere protein X isoform X1 n=1 Tax=Canis lupus dingo TaxID=286419 RepID=UPI0020C38933|nr:centromere protein X isoform X1 [Canis lupus dingo]
MEATGGGFRKELVSKLLQMHFTDSKTKAGGSTRSLEPFPHQPYAPLLENPVSQGPPRAPSSELPASAWGRGTWDAPSLPPCRSRSGYPQRPTGPGRGPGSCGCGPAGEGATSAAPGLLGAPTPTAPAVPVKTKPCAHISVASGPSLRSWQMLCCSRGSLSCC